MLSRVLFAALLGVAHADVYMHNPRGSNDRNCERNVNRRNGNRLFDSQNNNKGGYACGRPVGGPEVKRQDMEFFVGSQLPIEWTSQHGCGGNGKLHCEIVLQYACEDTLDVTKEYRGAGGTDVGTPRDGIPRDAADSATDRIPDNAASAKADTTETRRFGMHEPQSYYAACKARERNKGLFAADQNVRRNDARGTRQNPNGNRNGLECPEERDYFPYWAPSPWRDIAVITSSYSELKKTYYQKNSNNRGKAKIGSCGPAAGAAAEAAFATLAARGGRIPNNEAACTALDIGEAKGVWTVSKAFNAGGANVPEIDVVQGQFSRVNHLGNSGGVVTPGKGNDANGANNGEEAPQGTNANRYMWKIPDTPNANCVLRMRYNISTFDYDAWENGNLNIKGTFTGNAGINSTLNCRKKKGVDCTTKSPVTQDPYVSIGAANADGTPNEREFLSLAMNTNQYGRTFQDRSYVFSIKARPAGVAASTNIVNLNVRGKRGNIVQAYPAVEYDFVPNDLVLNPNDQVHFQWTGSDYNPRRGCNNGEGGPPDPNTVEGAKQNARADRSNIVETMHKMGGSNYPADITSKTAAEAIGIPGYKNPGSMFTTDGTNADMKTIKNLAFLGQEATLTATGTQCLTRTELDEIRNKNQREQHPRNCAKLNAQATPYFNAGLVSMKKAGMFSYFSSRNNNFSNRDQTGSICVKGTGFECKTSAASGGGATLTNEDDPTFLAAVAANLVKSMGLEVGDMETVEVLNAELLPATTETSSPQEKDNEAEGDGNAQACEEILWELLSKMGVPGIIGVAIAFMAAGVMFGIIGRIVYEKHTKGTMSNAAANNNKASVQMPKVVTNNAQKQVGTFNGAAATDHI